MKFFRVRDIFFSGSPILFGVSFLLLLMVSCANPITPEGGPKDEEPPKVEISESTPNFQTNFTPTSFELTFNEWVTLSDVFNQVITSPPLEFDPDISLKKKTLTFTFDENEVLRDEATYTIQFGEAIKDLTEGNPAEDLRFVFSTGPVLDSLSIGGTIVDARTGQPVEDILFMLYENTADTVVRTERPFYFAKSGEGGVFNIRNVKPGRFKGFALNDQNLNYRFDQGSEAIGFPDELITVSDSTPDVRIRLFVETPLLKVIKTDQDDYGVIKFAFNRKVYQLDVDTLNNPPSRWYSLFDQDTVRLFYAYDQVENSSFILRQDTTILDTVTLQAPDRSTFLAETFLTTLPNGQGNNLVPGTPVMWQFDRPIRQVDTNYIIILPDSVAASTQIVWEIDSADNRSLQASGNWKTGINYELQMAPGAFTDWHGRTTADTLKRPFSINTKDNYGNMLIQVTGLDSTQQYVIELLLREKVVAQWTVVDISEYKESLSLLLPGTYSLRVIQDTNTNGRWDPGNYDEQLQPEILQERELEQLRANWDLDVTFEWDSTINGG